MLKVETKHTLKICKAHITHTVFHSLFLFLSHSPICQSYAAKWMQRDISCRQIFQWRAASNTTGACVILLRVNPYKPNWANWIFGKNIWIPFTRKFIQINFKKTLKQTHTLDCKACSWKWMCDKTVWAKLKECTNGKTSVRCVWTRCKMLEMKDHLILMPHGIVARSASTTKYTHCEKTVQKPLGAQAEMKIDKQQ